MQLFEISIRKKDYSNYFRCRTEAVCENIFDECQVTMTSTEPSCYVFLLSLNMIKELALLSDIW